MGAYEYRALTATGRTERGIRQGDSPRQVRQNLRDAGLVPLSVKAVGETAGRQSRFTRPGFSRREIALLTRQLSSLLRAGLPLVEALAAVAAEGSAKESRVLGTLRARLAEGQSLAAALAAEPRYFPPMYTAAVAAGERSGKLERVLDRLAAHLEARESLGRDVGMALLYPVLLVVVALAVVGGLVTYVVPRVVEVFTRLDQALPLATRILIGTSDFLRHYGIGLVLLLAALALAAHRLLQQEQYRRPWQKFLLRTPLIGMLLRAQETAHVAGTLAMLLASAVPLVEALRATSRVVTTLVFRDALLTAARHVSEGQSLHRALAQSGLLPPVTLRLIASGERSGELAALLDQAAGIHERQLASALGVISGVLQPALIIAVGALVLFIVLAIMLPILDLNLLVG